VFFLEKGERFVSDRIPVKVLQPLKAEYTVKKAARDGLLRCKCRLLEVLPAA
jgi:hypothetical protein